MDGRLPRASKTWGESLFVGQELVAAARRAIGDARRATELHHEAVKTARDDVNRAVPLAASKFVEKCLRNARDLLWTADSMVSAVARTLSYCEWLIDHVEAKNQEEVRVMLVVVADNARILKDRTIGLANALSKAGMLIERVRGNATEGYLVSARSATYDALAGRQDLHRSVQCAYEKARDAATT